MAKDFLNEEEDYNTEMRYEGTDKDFNPVMQAKKLFDSLPPEEQTRADNVVTKMVQDGIPEAEALDSFIQQYTDPMQYFAMVEQAQKRGRKAGIAGRISSAMYGLGRDYDMSRQMLGEAQAAERQPVEQLESRRKMVKDYLTKRSELEKWQREFDLSEQKYLTDVEYKNKMTDLKEKEIEASKVSQDLANSFKQMQMQLALLKEQRESAKAEADQAKKQAELGAQKDTLIRQYSELEQSKEMINNLEDDWMTKPGFGADQRKALLQLGAYLGYEGLDEKASKLEALDSLFKGMQQRAAKLLGVNPTDRDLQFIVEASPSIGKTPSGLREIIERMQRGVRNTYQLQFNEPMVAEMATQEQGPNVIDWNDM